MTIRAANIGIVEEAALEDLSLVPPGPVLDRLLDAVMRGEKTATSALEIGFTQIGAPLPRIGQRYRLLDSERMPVLEIEVTDVRVRRLADIELDVALAEGDWFHSIADWRIAHERFWNGKLDEYRSLTSNPTWSLNDDTRIVVRFFRVL